MRPGDHAAFSFTAEEQQAHVIGPFVRDGLEARDKVIYVNAAEAGRLPGVHSGADVDRATATGQLRLIPQAAVCLSEAGAAQRPEGGDHAERTEPLRTGGRPRPSRERRVPVSAVLRGTR
ncbi:MAG: MEDS domain-containing protein [Actinoallomurus sp.]